MEEGREEGGRRREEEGGRGKEVRGRRKGGGRRKKGWREEEIIYLGLHRRACFRCIGELFWGCFGIVSNEYIYIESGDLVLQGTCGEDFFYIRLYQIY